MYSLSRPAIAAELAKLSFEETGMGTYEAKVKRFTGKLPQIWEEIKSVKTVGEVARFYLDRTKWRMLYCVCI